MRRIINIPVVLLSGFVFFLHLARQDGICQPSQLLTPIEDSVYSRFTIIEYDMSFNNHAYRLYIAEPKAEAPGVRPVLYMLDGNGQFPILMNQTKVVTPYTPVIVGIGYPIRKAYPKERTRDYTIPMEGDSIGGEAEPFYRFIMEMVKPFVEERYRVDKTRQTLCGHSHGGLFTLYVAFNHTDAFRNYFAASPSVWWADGDIVPRRRPVFLSKPKSVTISLGEFEENPRPDGSGRDTNPEAEKRKQLHRNGTTARDVASLIETEVADTRFILYEGKSHGSSIPYFLKDVLQVAETK